MGGKLKPATIRRQQVARIENWLQKARWVISTQGVIDPIAKSMEDGTFYLLVAAEQLLQYVKLLEEELKNVQKN